jgi:hypothetical protein
MKWLLYHIAVHDVHAVAPANEYSPQSQSRHVEASVAPTAVEYLPASQVPLIAAVPVQKEPAGQAVQTQFDTYWPIGHEVAHLLGQYCHAEVPLYETIQVAAAKLYVPVFDTPIIPHEI